MYCICEFCLLAVFAGFVLKSKKCRSLKKNRHLKKQIIEYKLIMKTLYYVFGLLWVDSVIIGIFKFL